MNTEELELKFAALIETAEIDQKRLSESIGELDQTGEKLQGAVRRAVSEAIQSALKPLRDELDRAQDVVVDLQRFSLWRAAWQHVMVALVAIVITVLAVWWYVPSLSEIASRRAEVATAEASLADLNRRGAKIQLSRCGPKKSFCVRIDESAGRFGDANKNETYMIPQGY